VRLGVVMLVVTAARLIDRRLLRIGRGKGATALGFLYSGGGGTVQARGEAKGGRALGV